MRFTKVFSGNFSKAISETMATTPEKIPKSLHEPISVAVLVGNKPAIDMPGKIKWKIWKRKTKNEEAKRATKMENKCFSVLKYAVKRNVVILKMKISYAEATSLPVPKNEPVKTPERSEENE